MPPSRMHVAVVVLNYKGWQDTLACVQSLLAGGLPCQVSIVVLDNASPNGSLQHLVAGMQVHIPNGIPLHQLSQAEAEQGARAAPPSGQAQLVLIQNTGNWGFAGGCNPGIRWAMAAGADFFWLLNNDTEVGEGALAALLKRFEQKPTIGLCGSKLIYHNNREAIQARGGASFDPRSAMGTHLGIGESIHAPEDPVWLESQMDYVVGASMMASRAFIEKVGLMMDDYLLYFEELDWAIRGKRLGFTLGYAPDSLVFHKEGATIGSSHRQYASPLSQSFLCRNRLLLTKRFYPQQLWRVRARMMLEVLVWLARRVPGHALITAQALVGRTVTLPR